MKPNPFGLKELLPEQTAGVIIYGHIVIENERLLELQERFTNSIQENYDWFVEYGQNNDLPLPYHEYMGLTIEEYNELRLLYDTTPMRLGETGRQEIQIKHNRNTISFSGTGPLEFFNQVQINLVDTTIQMVNNLLKYSHTDTVLDPNNVYQSAWFGHKWRYSYPDNMDELTAHEIKTELIQIYTFQIGKLESTGKTFFHIKGLEIINGEKYIDFEAPIMFE
ncbi:MAG: hypothetical protein ACK4VN_15935 [Bacteroidales bacterium]